MLQMECIDAKVRADRKLALVSLLFVLCRDYRAVQHASATPGFVIRAKKHTAISIPLFTIPENGD